MFIKYSSSSTSQIHILKYIKYVVNNREPNSKGKKVEYVFKEHFLQLIELK